MTEAITYARAGGPPDDWFGLEVIDLDTGKKIERVVECDTEAGWVLFALADDDGLPFLDAWGDVAMHRSQGRYDIRRPAPDTTP